MSPVSNVVPLANNCQYAPICCGYGATSVPAVTPTIQTYDDPSKFTISFIA